MDFGKLSNVDHVNFSLPPTTPETVKVLQAAPKGKKAEIYIGCPVWGEKDWVGKIYPAGTKPKEFLHYYATQFNSIELNGTHYNFPNELLVEKWKADVPGHFKFCPKLTQDISHINRLVNVGEMVELFCRNIALLGQNLGTCFLQLPPDFSPVGIDDVIRFAENWPKTVKLVVEFRHPGWFSDKNTSNEVMAALQYHGIGIVITDVAGRRDAAHMRLTTPEAFIRFGANDLHPTDYERLDIWAGLLNQWMKDGLQTLYFFLHTKTRHYNLELAIYIISVLNKMGHPVKPPYRYTEPEKPKLQNSLF